MGFGRKKTTRSVTLVTAVIFSCMPLFAMHVAADSTSSDGRALTQGFTVTGKVSDYTSGALVSTQATDTKTISLTSIDNSELLVGVVDTSPLIAITPGDNAVPVVLNGTTAVLVSDINGDVQPGDAIAASPIVGVGMKATTDSRIVGTAQSSMTTSSTRQIKDQNGNEHSVKIGYIQALVAVGDYRNPASSFVSPVFQHIANQIVGHPVSPIRVLVAGALLLIGFTSIGVLLYATIRSTIISLGRNPLATKSIRKGAMQVGILASAAIIGILLGTYIILKI